MLAEVIKALAPQAGSLYVDGTLGAGGHALGLLRAADGKIRLLGLDRDPSALALAADTLAGHAVELQLGNFDEMAVTMQALDMGPAQGVLLDLGVSSMQLDQAERGFSFMKDAPLDMRMGDKGPTAAQLIAQSGESELAAIIKKYGEEPYARSIARKLARQRVETTGQLAKLVEESLPAKERRRRNIHPATLVFQALRIALNDELGALGRFLEQIPRLLAKGGRLAVISYHSLEDRLVKQAFVAYANSCTCPPGLPVCVCGSQALFKIVNRRPQVATDSEVAANPRARSAKLRVLEAL